MSKIDSFEELECWKESRILVKTIYTLCSEKNEIDRDTSSQIKRASLSVMNNIAEGFGRLSNKEFMRFLNIATSSAAEVKSILYVLEDMKYISSDIANELREQVDKTRKLIHGLIRYLNSTI